jgi:hypothetical protein
MRKPKPKLRKTALDWLTAQFRTILRREITDVVLAAKLLIESRKHLKHGEWQPWLAKKFDLSYRTAVNYCDATAYVARQQKCNAIADLANLAPTVLYRLAAGQYGAKEEAAILAATRKGRVDQTIANVICAGLAPPDEPDDEEPDDADKAAIEPAENDPEIAAILDGPPPEAPPPAPNMTPDYALGAFDVAVSALKQLMTKPAARFVCSVHASDLQGVESFIRAVADRARESARTESGNGYAPHHDRPLHGLDP